MYRLWIGVDVQWLGGWVHSCMYNRGLFVGTVAQRPGDRGQFLHVFPPACTPSAKAYICMYIYKYTRGSNASQVKLEFWVPDFERT